MNWQSIGIEGLRPLDFFGFYLPPLVLWMLVAFVPFLALRWSLRRLGAYGFVWHRPLFDVSLYVVVLGILIFSGGTRWL